MLTELMIDTTVQWIAFLFIPLLVFLIFFRKKYNFFHYLGLKKPEKINKKLFFSVLLLSIVYLSLNIFWFQKYNLGTDDIRLLSFLDTGFSIQTILILLIQSIILTSFLEELVFRGFLINTFKHNFGFTISNHIQSVVFTVIHTLGMIQMDLSTLDIMLGTLSVYMMSFYFGKLMKESGYSIFYSALFHGLINIITGIVLISFS